MCNLSKSSVTDSVAKLDVNNDNSVTTNDYNRPKFDMIFRPHHEKSQEHSGT